MKRSQFIGIFICALLFVILVPQPAMAYVGPGTGIAALGALLAIIAGVFVAIFGFLWYPIKRLLSKPKQEQKKHAEEKEKV